MMELSVWEQGEQIGTVTAQQDGLFYIFICKISKHAEQLRRIYVISKWRVEYLGIPYPRREGAELQACIPVSHFPGRADGRCGGCHAARRVAPVVRRGGRRSHPQRPAQAAGGRLCACPAARRGAAAPAMAAAGGGAGAYGPGAAGVPARCGGMHALHRNDRKRRKYR